MNAYRADVGWGQREVTVSITVDAKSYARRLEIADGETQQGVEYKTGCQSATKDNLWEVERDAALVKSGWDIQWVFRDEVSAPLKKSLEDAGIRCIVGGVDNK